MQHALLELICCPGCGTAVEVVPEEESAGEIWQGQLICPQCQTSYSITKGIPYLFIDDTLWKSKAQEAQGWIDLHKELGLYDQIDEGDLKLPYSSDPTWQRFAENFDTAVKELALTGLETVLDLGAGRGWAAKQFALYGCRVVAIDILADEIIGLGRAWAMMEDADVYFSPLIADGERLPLFPESADLVFCSAALHHSSNLPLLLQNIHRMLKPGGKLCAINEPVISIFEDEHRVLEQGAGRELKHGINENCPDLLQYYGTLHDLGFGNIQTWKTGSHSLSTVDLLNWAKEAGAVRPDLSVPNSQQEWRRWWRYFSIHLRSLSRRRAIKLLLTAEHARENLLRLMMLYTTGDFSFIAQKL